MITLAHRGRADLSVARETDLVVSEAGERKIPRNDDRPLFLLLFHYLKGFVLVPQSENRFRAAAGIPSFRSKANSTDKKGIAVRSSLVLGYTGLFVRADAIIGRLFLATPPAMPERRKAETPRFTRVRTHATRALQG